MAPERVQSWLAGFDARRGALRTIIGRCVMRVEGADGARAECHVPFPPLPPGLAGAHEGLQVCGPVDHAQRDRLVGVLLARRGGHAAGVFEGSRLIASKVDSRPVRGRSKAGGQSQKRFQRRREHQAREAARAAADVASRVLVPYLDHLEAVVPGGDRGMVQALRDDARLCSVFALATERFLTVPDPKLAVLRETPRQFRAVLIRLVEPHEARHPVEAG